MKYLWILLFIFPLNVFSQHRLSGVLTDAETKEPVQYATVYINGTTKGVITDKTGSFYLDNISVPCEVIISHVSYEKQTIQLDDASNLNLVLSLRSQKINISEVTVQDKSLRDKNVEIFEKCFLGNDTWGNSAILENESVLIFQTVYQNNEKREIVGGEKWMKNIQGIESLTASSQIPLKIYLPLLGYNLHADLINFELYYNSTTMSHECKFLGNFFYSPIESVGGGKSKKYDKKRLDTYYNSGMHFLRSLYNDELDNNGYSIHKMVLVDGEYKKELFGFDMMPHLTYIEDDLAVITGLAGVRLSIEYFSKGDEPLDLSERTSELPKESEIYFLKDTCSFRSNGTIPNTNIMFKKTMGNKQLGASLPSDYLPEN